jgi:hypothetical protein
MTIRTLYIQKDCEEILEIIKKEGYKEGTFINEAIKIAFKVWKEQVGYDN